MSDGKPRDRTGGVLGDLRHALADPLSAAGLKLELVERRLAPLPDGPALAGRIRSAKADLAEASRLLDLLDSLAEIDAEVPAGVSLADLCRTAGIEPQGNAAPPLSLRRQATLDALRILARVLRPHEPSGPPLRASFETAPDGVSLRIEATVPRREGDGADPGRLLRLPHGEGQAEEIFLARAAVEADGGSFALGEHEGRLVALLSWPAPPGGRGPSA